MYTLPKRSPHVERVEQLVKVSVTIIKDDGLEKFTRMNVANMAGIAPSSVNAIFGTMDGLREAVVQFAIDELHDNLDDELMLHIVADGLVKGYQTAKLAPRNIRKAAMISVM